MELMTSFQGTTFLDNGALTVKGRCYGDMMQTFVEKFAAGFFSICLVVVFDYGRFRRRRRTVSPSGMAGHQVERKCVSRWKMGISFFALCVA